jgi:RNase P protein component
VKRLLREAYRKNRCRMGPDREFVILAGESSFTKSLVEIEEELLRGLKKAGMLND